MPNQPSLEQMLEAVLFVSSQPLGPKQLSQATDRPIVEVQQALKALALALENRGVRLQEFNAKYSLITSPTVGPAVEKFLGIEARAELSKPALETLAIIAYKQPVTRSEVETIRGVSCEQTIRNLLARGLITEDPHLNASTRARLYVTSSKFLQHFGFSHAHELPNLDIDPEPPAP